MNQRIRNLWIRGLCGSGEAYRRLGICFLTGRGCRKDRRLARLCLKQAAELGCEEGYFLYHKLFSSGKRVIDDNSYREMCRAYAAEENQKERRKLQRYLTLGTKKQKARYFVNMTKKHCKYDNKLI